MIEPAGTSEHLLACTESDLQRPWFRIAFGDEIEPLYRRATEAIRVPNHTIIILLSLILFDLFLFPERLMMPDAFEHAKLFHLGIVTPSVSVAVFLLRLGMISSSATAMIFLSNIIVAVLSIVLESQSPQAILMVFAIPMVLVYGTVLPLPFRCALALAAGTGLATCCATFVHPAFDTGSGMFAVAVTTSLSAFALLATYRLEISERRSFLLSLAEQTRTAMLAKRNRTLQGLSDSDGLTGIGNRRAFDATLGQLWDRCAQAQSPITLIMIDIDHFKRLNDVHGHLGGDQSLCLVAGVVDRCTQGDSAFAFRYGGDEFAILVAGTGDQAAAIAEQSRAGIQRLTVARDGEDSATFRITASLGHATMVPGVGSRPEMLVAAADQALYTAKRRGRNCVHPDLAPESGSIRHVA